MAADTTGQQPAAQPAAQAPPPAPVSRPAATPVARGPLVDEPWTPTLTGIVDPGMTRDQVIATWGEPELESAAGDRLYLFFRNGCEVTCGTFDVVFFVEGAVVDAIVRGPGHDYSGQSSSPPGREALPTLPTGGSMS